MDIRKLQRAIVDGLEDVKAQDIQVFNTEHLSPLFERVIIASGNSNRQTKALASSVRESVKSSGLSVLRTEGEDNGEWIIVDCGAAVAHIMQPAIRDYYRLEEIWGGKPVKVQLDGGKKGLVKASEPDDDEDEEPAPKKAPKAAKPTAARKVSTGAAKTAAADKAPAKKVAAKKVAAKKAPVKAAGKTTAKTTATKTAAKTAPRKKTVEAPVQKIVVNGPAKKSAAKAPAKKAAVKKPAVKKTTGVTAKAATKPAATKTTAAKKTTARRA
jgi:ribosome-associated protein